jgi:hypothetical protein
MVFIAICILIAMSIWYWAHTTDTGQQDIDSQYAQLLSKTNTNPVTNSSIYFVGDTIQTKDLCVLFTIAIDATTKEIYTHSSECLYLLPRLYANYYESSILSEFVQKIKRAFLKNYTDILGSTIDRRYSSENVIPLITSYSMGSVHGYSALFYMLTEYIANYTKYRGYKLIVYKNSQQGILDIIHHFTDISALDRNDILYIEPNVKYLFNSILFIPNNWHVYPLSFTFSILDSHILKFNRYPLLDDAICIMKTNNSTNTTSVGEVNMSRINDFCTRNSLTFVEPNSMNEIQFIHRVNRARMLVVSWGTAFLKNYVYISDTCEKVVVLIIGDFFRVQYEIVVKNNICIHRYKNADFVYRIVDDQLNITI